MCVSSTLVKTVLCFQPSSRAREEITALFAYHVDGIKKIYSSAVFQYENLGPYGGFTFAVHRIQVPLFTSVSCDYLSTFSAY